MTSLCIYRTNRYIYYHTLLLGIEPKEKSDVFASLILLMIPNESSLILNRIKHKTRQLIVGFIKAWERKRFSNHMAPLTSGDWGLLHICTSLAVDRIIRTPKTFSHLHTGRF